MIKMAQHSTNQKGFELESYELELEESEQYFQSPIVVSLADLASNNSTQKELSLKQKNLTAAKISDVLLEAIDETLTSLGEPVKNSIYIQLQIAFNIEKEEIPDRIGEFATFIRKVFGCAAYRLESKFIKTIEEKLGENASYDAQTLKCMSFKEYCYNLCNSQP